MKKILILCFITCFALSCKTIEVIREVPVEVPKIVHRSDTLTLLQRDSIFVHQKNDTIFIEKFKTVFQEKIKVQIDTIYKPVEILTTEIKKEYKKGFFYHAGIVAMSILLIIFVVILVKFYRKLTMNS